MKYFKSPFSIFVGSILLLASLSGLPATHAQVEVAASTAVTPSPDESFANDGMEYRWRPDLKAIKHAEGKVSLRQQGRSVAEASEPMEVNEILEEKGIYMIYRPHPSPPSSGSAIRRSQHSQQDIHTFPIVINQTTGRLGVVTDDLMLKLKNPETASAIAEEYGLAFSYMNDLIRTAVYKISVETDIKELRERLIHDPRVERVTLSIVDRIRRPR